jgi:Protein of unknown function (DUF3501)
MPAIQRSSLLTLEAYAKARPQFRAQVIAHKKNRLVTLGNHVALLFEDETTIRYQIQEMLRVERIFEEDGIQGELDAYNPLIPDGHNWKVTMQIEYEDPAERARMLARLIGVEDRVWVKVGTEPRVYAIADEDLERENADKTASVHFLRFELTLAMIGAARTGAAIGAGIDHPNYNVSVPELPASVRDALSADLSGD